MENNNDEILNWIRKGKITYVFNIPNRNQNQNLSDGYAIRKASTDNNVPLFSSPDTMEIFLKVLKRITISVKPM